MPFKEVPWGNMPYLGKVVHFLNTSTYYFFYLDVFPSLILKKFSYYYIPRMFSRPNACQPLDGGVKNVGVGEYDTSSCENRSPLYDQYFTWDEGNVTTHIHQTRLSLVLNLPLVIGEFCNPRDHPDEIDNITNHHHVTNDIIYTMVGGNSYKITNVFQIVDQVKCNPIKTYQDDGALHPTLMVMSGPHYCVLISNVDDNFTIESLSHD